MCPYAYLPGKCNLKRCVAMKVVECVEAHREDGNDLEFDHSSMILKDWQACIVQLSSREGHIQTLRIVASPSPGMRNIARAPAQEYRLVLRPYQGLCRGSLFCQI